MEIKIIAAGTPENSPPTPLELFADMHGLVMEVRERGAGCGHCYYAQFAHSETKDKKTDVMLAGTHGNGMTVEQAIADYVPRIVGKILVINAHTPSRKEIQVPDLIR